jgi:hypothetical protein
MEIRDELRIFERTYFSIAHIAAATHFAKLSVSLEADDTRIFLSPGRFSEDWLFEHNAYVTASILSTVAFLEAVINELFSDALDNHWGEIERLNATARRSLAEMWKKVKDDRRVGTLEKYQRALEATNKEKFKEGNSPFQPVKAVINLRNALVHYVPETRESPTAEATELEFLTNLEKYLKGKFDPSPLYRKSSEPFFPARCLSAGCARWVVTNGITFTDAFFSKLGLTARYDGVRSRLTI